MTHFSRRTVAAALAAALLLGAPAAHAEFTNDQIKELLNELKLIRQALEKQAAGGPQAGAAAPGAPADDKVSMQLPTAGVSMGREDAPLVMIEYTDYQCPFCQQFHNTAWDQIKRNYIDTGKVRFIMREFPIGKTSGAATIALRCASPDKYLTLYGKFMEQQSAWVSQEVRLDPVFKVAAQVGMTRQQFDACRENQAMIDGLKWVKDRGRKLGVMGTPNFFVARKLVKKELTLEDIRAMVDPLLAGPATASAGTPN